MLSILYCANKYMYFTFYKLAFANAWVIDTLI